MHRIAWVVAAAALLGGCLGGVSRVYEGQPRQQNEIALLRGIYQGWVVMPLTLDGNIPLRNHAWYELLPGDHTVEWVGFNPGFGEGMAKGTLAFTAQCGRIYALRAIQGGKQLGASIEDITNSPFARGAWQRRSD